MTLEGFIRELVLETLAAQSADRFGSRGHPAENRRCIVMAGEKTPLGELLSDRLAEAGWGVQRQNRQDCIDDFPEAEAVIIAELPLEEMAALSRIVPNGVLSRFVLSALSAGVTVYCLKEGLCYREMVHQVAEGFYQSLRKAEETIRSFGIKVVESEALCRRFSAKRTDWGRILAAGQVITETRIRQALAGSDAGIIIPSRALITPLARDMIREHRDRFVMEDTE